MSNTKIGKILEKLLTEQKIRVSELARRIQLPQPTVQRIVTGVCENPHISSLKPIANYFAITVEQLKGLEPIPRFDKVYKLPMISWSEAVNWKKDSITQTKHYVIADISVGENAYALKTFDSSMDPMFPVDTTLIIDPHVIAKDKSYIIALINGINIPIFRQLIINGSEQYLKPLSPDTDIYRMLRFKDLDEVLGVVVQARWNYTC